MEFKCPDPIVWKQSLSEYEARLESLGNNKKKPDLVSLDEFYRKQLPPILHQRNPNSYITTSELSKLMQWKLTRGKWRPRLLDFVSSLDEELVKSTSQKAFQALPDISKAISELSKLKGVGPATASAVLAAYAPDVAPFMSDEAMEAALGNSKDYTLKQYLVFVEKLQEKSKELSAEGELFTPSDVERAIWSSSIGAKYPSLPNDQDIEASINKSSKRKRKQ
ncbi:putative DNA-binding protein-like [Heracleum sosnowskyi]|uniref:DNA-binding protein-like n=1 Tax=Heracleum sosnowskyi TaxID=360622 RepID=A0AAD8HGF9_9APIA|nr:putative DNA-binding protein-like [Heracleum sosnowskyi]